MFEKLKNRNRAQEGDGVQKFGPELDFSTAEAYNLLRTNLSFAFPGKTDGKLIGITSPSPAEGKSYTAVNLAYALAKDGQRVLLIDADMRKPTIAEKMHVRVSPGLSNLLVDREGTYILENILHENLSVLTAGDIPPNPSELIGSDEMKRDLQEFKTKYDYILVDLPPVMEVTDPLVMAKHLDGMLVTVMHERSYRSDIKETVRKLRFANARILGFVYNGYSSASGRDRKKYLRHYSAKNPPRQKNKII